MKSIFLSDIVLEKRDWMKGGKKYFSIYVKLRCKKFAFSEINIMFVLKLIMNVTSVIFSFKFKFQSSAKKLTQV